MSFDLEIQTKDVDGNPEYHSVVQGHTYNLAPMWNMALLGVIKSTSDLQGMNCRELAPHLELALMEMLDDPTDYEALNPENGWGDFNGFLQVFARFTIMCYKYPSGSVVWCG